MTPSTDEAQKRICCSRSTREGSKCFSKEFPFELGGNSKLKWTEMKNRMTLAGPVALVSIVGRAGTGKSAVARELYSHPSGREAFSFSDVFDLVDITRHLTELVTLSSYGCGE